MIFKNSDTYPNVMEKKHVKYHKTGDKESQVLGLALPLTQKMTYFPICKINGYNIRQLQSLCLKFYNLTWKKVSAMFPGDGNSVG